MKVPLNGGLPVLLTVNHLNKGHYIKVTLTGAVIGTDVAVQGHLTK